MLNARRTLGRKGFTLLELIVVILIIGILAAFAVPQYMKSLENNKADDAAALINMVATTNRMYALDHGGTYTVGTLTSACASQTSCPASGGAADPCSLVSCKYLAATDFDKKPYVIAAGNKANCLSWAGSIVACGARRTTGFNSTAQAPYSSWGYTVDDGGVVTNQGGAPAATQ
jgi:prepilin-type N-terminal cleavage/methylation domain-containing protein